MIEKGKPLIDLKSAAIPLLPDRLCPLIEDAFSFSGVNGVYDEISARMAGTGYRKNFFETTLDVLGLSLDIKEGDLEKIPGKHAHILALDPVEHQVREYRAVALHREQRHVIELAEGCAAHAAAAARGGQRNEAAIVADFLRVGVVVPGEDGVRPITQ